MQIPEKLPVEVVASWRRRLHAAPGATIAIDLLAQTVTGPDGTSRSFEIDAFAKTCLLEGVDDIKLTLQYEAQISAYEKRAAIVAPWVFDPQDTAR